MKSAQRRLRRLRRWLSASVAALLVSAAALMALGRLLVPWLIDSPEQVAGWLSERIGRSVELESVSAYWDGPGPVLDLGGLKISAMAGEQAAITLGRARVHTDVYALLLPGRHLIRDFLLVDASLALVRETDGRVTLEGFGRSVPGGQGLSQWLGRVGHVGLSGGRLGLVDRASGRSFELDAVELRMRQQGDRLTLGLERHAAVGDGRLRVVLEQRGPLQWPPRDAELYLEAARFPIADLGGLSAAFDIQVRTGVLDGQQWTGWRERGLASSVGDWQVQGLVLSAPGFDWTDGGIVEPNLHLEAGRLVLDGRDDGTGFVADIQLRAGEDGAAPETAISLRMPHGGGVRVTASDLSLAVLAGTAQLVSALPSKLRSGLYVAQPQGVIRELMARVEDGRWQVHADVADVSLRPAAPRWPAVQDLDLNLSADAAGVVVRVNADAMQFAIPGVFREPVDVASLDGLAGIYASAGGWTTEVPIARVQGVGFAADLALRVDQDPDSGPLLQAVAHVPGAEIEAAKAFWAINRMPPRTVQWLDAALGVGHVDTGQVVFRGALRDWPFVDHQGRFEARFAVSGAGLDYHPDWPAAQDLSAEGAFINSSMVIDSATGTLLGNRVVRGRGGIPAMKDPILELDLGGVGDAANWLQLMKASPLRRSHADVLFGMDMRGPASVDAKIIIPLRPDLGRSSVEGKALLDGIAFSDTKWDLEFAEVRGRADFSDSGFAADRLTLDLGGHGGELSLAVGAFSSDPALQVEAALHGQVSAQALFGHHAQLATILGQVSGSAAWDVDVKVPRKLLNGAPVRSQIRYRSDLVGIAVAFPTPLGKPAETRLPLQLMVELSSDEAVAPQLRLDLGDRARLLAVVGTRTSDFRGQLQLGAEVPRDLPARGLRVSGRADEIDVAGWAGWVFATTTGAPGDAVLSDIDVGIGGADHLRLDRSEGPWVLHLDGPTATGQVRFEGEGERPAAVVAQFERLHLPEPGAGVGEMSITPAMVPTLHLWVRDLRIGDAQLGEARLEAFASDGGLRVDLLEARSPHLQIHASGDWSMTAGGAQSRFKIRMVAEDLGRMLSGLGFAGVIAGGQTLAEIDAHWRGAPYAFALERLSGFIDVSIGQGRFLDVDPGAGRIFGLLSLRELPRRLTLDFRDLFQTGMSFDRIEGRFQLADGNAWTENLTVRGPAADILIIGRTGLASRDYDQQVMVAPHVSGMLPVIGGLAAGPVGAAAGFLAQGMVTQGDDIESSSRVHYSIAGSWEKPVVARLTPVRPDAPVRRRESSPPGGAG